MRIADALALLFLVGALLTAALVAIVASFDRFRSWFHEKKAAARLERRVRRLADQLGWSCHPGNDVLWRSLRGHVDGHEATFNVGCPDFSSDWAELTLRGGPWLPPGHEIRPPHYHLDGKDLLDVEASNFKASSNRSFVVTPATSFADISHSLGALAFRASVAHVRPGEISFGRVELPKLRDDEGTERIFAYVREGLAHAREWAEATAAWHRYR
jgi:hypothetical protein